MVGNALFYNISSNILISVSPKQSTMITPLNIIFKHIFLISIITIQSNQIGGVYDQVQKLRIIRDL